MSYDERSPEGLLEASLNHTIFLLPLECSRVSVSCLEWLRPSFHQPGEAKTQDEGAEEKDASSGTTSGLRWDV